MSTGFSANQYESAFKAKRLQQWTAPQVYRERPVQRTKTTKTIVNDRGHILDPAKKSQEAPALGYYLDTWSMTKQDMVKTVPSIKRTGAFTTTKKLSGTTEGIPTLEQKKSH